MEDSLEKAEGMNDLSKNDSMSANNLAKLIAAVVRNKMEDFHAKHLSDAQMEELNPIIRNAIYTALVQLKLNPEAMHAYGQLYIPADWEDCKLVDL